MLDGLDSEPQAEQERRHVTAKHPREQPKCRRCSDPPIADGRNSISRVSGTRLVTLSNRRWPEPTTTGNSSSRSSSSRPCPGSDRTRPALPLIAMLRDCRAAAGGAGAREVG